MTPGRVLGHEAVGTVVETGRDVRTIRPGDRVLISCITACGRCGFCREARNGQCRGGGGWILGHLVDCTQAEYVRVPFADLSAHPLPNAVDSFDAVLLTDIFPTAYEVGVLNGGVRPGDAVVVVGAGPVGLAAVATARLYSPGRIIAVDLVASRLATARKLGADATVTADEGPEQLVEDLTAGLGAWKAGSLGAGDRFEVAPAGLATDLRREVFDLLTAAERIYHLSEFGDEAIHDWGGVHGDFLEFVLIDRSAGQITLLVAADD